MSSSFSTFTLIMLAMLAFSSCTSKSSKPTDKSPLNNSDFPVKMKNNDSVFPLPEIPAMITKQEDQAIYMSKHFWDLFPFGDTTLIAQPDITEQGFVDCHCQLSNLN